MMESLSHRWRQKDPPFAPRCERKAPRTKHLHLVPLLPIAGPLQPFHCLLPSHTPLPPLPQPTLHRTTSLRISLFRVSRYFNSSDFIILLLFAHTKAALLFSEDLTSHDRLRKAIQLTCPRLGKSSDSCFKSSRKGELSSYLPPERFLALKILARPHHCNTLLSLSLSPCLSLSLTHTHTIRLP